MTIIYCRTGETVEESIANILKDKGFDIYQFSKRINDVDYDQEYIQELTDVVEDKKHTMVWSLGYFPIIARVCKIAQIPYISWVIRETWNTLYSETVEYKTNFIFLAEENVATAFYSSNPGHIFYLPPGVELLETKIQNGTVGMCSYNMDFPKYYMKEECSPYLAGYISGLIEAQKKIYGYHFVSDIITKKVKKELSSILTEESKGKDYRKKPLKILIDDFLCDSITKEEQKEVEGLLIGTGYCYNKNLVCSVNVNVTSRKWKKGLPIDMLAIMGAGGFILTNYQPGMEEIFKIGEDLVVYEDKTDLIDKLNYYMKSEEERSIIAQKGREKVKNYYKLEQRINDIIYFLSV